jgi:septal ring factor EnvC (AmiA/AmiB activator)
MAETPNIRKIDFAKMMQEDLNREAAAIPQVRAPMPGRKPADAALEQYEVALRALESLREIIEKDVRGLEASLTKREDDMRVIIEAIEATREQSNHIRAQIDRADAVSASIRDAVAQLMKQIG